MRRDPVRWSIKLSALLWLVVSITLAAGWAAVAHGDDSGCIDPGKPEPIFYIKPAQVDLAQLLAPPPSLSSAAGKADLQVVVEAQLKRTPARSKIAADDGCISVFRFAEVIGPGFSAARLPFTAAFFTRVFFDGNREIGAAKAYFNRQRPFVVDPDIKTLVRQPANASYPSGHATFAYEAAILLAIMLPEKATAIFDRAAEYTESRVVSGVHFPTDLAAGRISAAVIDNVFLHEAKFQADLAKSKAEVRAALGISSPSGAAVEKRNQPKVSNSGKSNAVLPRNSSVSSPSNG
jgi:acid phosphatase (class A)